MGKYILSEPPSSSTPSIQFSILTTMLSLTATTAKPSLTTNHHPFSSPFLPLYHSLSFNPSHNFRASSTLSKPISATIIPSQPNPSQQQQRLYQPFRPPPSPIPPQYRSLDTNGRLEILTNRLGLWFEYAPLIPSLVQEGFAPSIIEELTGMSGVEQNCLVVASQVRESLVQAKVEESVLDFFDKGGAELLYEIRLLSVNERVAAAEYLVKNNLDGKGAQELARAFKDFPRRRGDRGWECFDYSLPGDCLGFMHYRLALEYQDGTEQRKAELELALELSESDKAKKWVTDELEGKLGIAGPDGLGGFAPVKVPVVRLMYGEVAEAAVVAVLPVCKAEEGEAGVVGAPWQCNSQGEFGVVVAEKGWTSWVVLPAWEPVAVLKRGGVAVAFNDARALPWKVNTWYRGEPILVVTDRGSRAVRDNSGFHLVTGKDGELKVERGSALTRLGVEESLGTVVLVVRPPNEDTANELADEDWE